MRAAAKSDMKIEVRHAEGGSARVLGVHAEKLLRRVLDGSSLSIGHVVVKLKTMSTAEGRSDHRCTITVKLISGKSVEAGASDGEGILAVYRAVDRLKFFLDQSNNGTQK